MSIGISNKTLDDLEFYSVLQRVASFSNSNLGRAAINNLKPIDDRAALEFQLKATNEYLSSYQNENKIPNHQFEEITKEIQLLGLEDSYLEASSFQYIAAISEKTNTLIKFFKKFKEYYPTLFALSAEITYTKELIEAIKKVINRFGEIADNASPELKTIRKEIHSIRGKIGGSFTVALNQAAAKGYLDEIKESVIDNQRVLAILAMHRKKIKGSLLGNSKTGSIVFIAPEATLKYSRELQNLTYDEQQEILRILKMLTDQIRPFTGLLSQYQEFMIALDVLASKAAYAHKIGALLPQFSKTKQVLLKDAYHPILFESNLSENIKTIPQTLELNQEQQIIVISGPNAGGKSITLKTIGLLQLMIQSGILIPVHERSQVHFFGTILTDIGDNQSIENHLSTYSYRLKNMRNFLRKCNEDTLFLIDEFGTGSDPELGGALAEIFLEEFYQKNAYGIITTHYSNLKVLADELEHVKNANMRFDEKTLEPLFQLYIGQAGSSYTFEVAQKNGIPYSLINRAKKKVEGEKIRLDKTISKLQKERNQLFKVSENLQKQENKAKIQVENLLEKEQKIEQKLGQFQELYDRDQKMIVIGRRINEIANTYFQANNKKKLLADFMKWILIEKNKYLKNKKPTLPVSKQQKKKLKTEELKKEESLNVLKKELIIGVKKIKTIKKEQEKKVEKARIDYTFKLNDRVRLIDGNAVGTIEKLEKNMAFINYGTFKTKAATSKLEIVEKAKTKKT